MNASPRFPRTVPIGLGVPLAIMLVAGWQRWRAAQWLLDAAPHGGSPEHWLALLPQLTLLLVLAAVVAFCAAWWAMRHAAARAMQSRDALLHIFDRGRRWLPGFMVLQTLLVFASLIGLLAFEAGHALGQPHLSRNAMKLLFAGGLLALVLLWYGVWIIHDTLRFASHKYTPEPIGLMGQLLTPAQAPRLWELVCEVAKQANARLPDAVVVGLNEGFFVTEHPVALGDGKPLPAGRVLYLPLPYMAFLDRAQVTAIIAHELGHFTGEDTRYSLHFAPIHRALAGSILALTDEHDDDHRAWLTAPAGLFGKAFLHSFDNAVHHWSRERELAADAIGSRVAGTEAAALALLRCAVLHEVIDEALARNRDAPPTQREGVLPLVRRLVAERGLADPHERLEDQQPHPLDTHPTLQQRLNALGVAITPELLARTRAPHDTGLLAALGLEGSTARTPSPLLTEPRQ